MANHILDERIKDLTRLEDVQLTVRLPVELAAQARELEKEAPEYLSQIVLYGLTRASIYRELRETQDAALAEAERIARGDTP